jgi:hypothetical protein
MSDIAFELQSWCNSVLDLMDKGLFCIARDVSHYDAMLLGVLTKNARLLCESTIDKEGTLYTPVCLTLAALARKLKLTIKAEYWKAAIENVLQLRHQLILQQPDAIGIYLGTPASIFMGQLGEALSNAGLLPRSTILNEENRKLALGLSLNWLLRFLLAYALEADKVKPQGKNVKDIAWIKGLLERNPDVLEGTKP